MKFSKTIADKLKPFEQLGCDFDEQREKEIVGTCPFTNDERKFFVNFTNQLWDAKTAGLHGDLQGFFKDKCEHNEQNILDKPIKLLELAWQRKLPAEAFEGYGIGWDGEKYTIPIMDVRGNVTDVRRVYLKNKKLKLYGMSGGKVGIFNCDALTDSQLKEDPIYICEGEWDAIALNFLLRKNESPGFAVGMPGSNTFKMTWAELFRKRNVTVCYDNDEAGANGEHTVLKRLSNVCKSISFIRWPDDLPDKFDIRDWVSAGHKRKIHSKSLKKLLELRVGTPRISLKSDVKQDMEPPKARKQITKRADHKDLYETFSTELKLENEDMLAIVMATVLANRLSGDPLWLLLVGNSGIGKTEFLTPLDGYEECLFTAEFTAHTLVSGMPSANGVDPSLLPKLDGMVLVVKDFTVILSMHPSARDEIFGQLREAYDGNYKKQFGNGLTREYESSFGMIAAVTNKVDEFGSLHAGLGERFIKYRIRAPKVSMENDIIMSAILKAGKEDNMRDNLRLAVHNFLDNTPDDEPVIDMETAKRIASMAIVVSRLRGTVSVNEYTGVQYSKATYEMGTRLAKQLVRLWKGLKMYADDSKLAIRLVRFVARGSVIDKRDEVVRNLAGFSADKPTGKDLASKCQGLSVSTVRRELEDLELLGITTREKRPKNKVHWSFTKDFDTLLKKASLYGD